MNTDTIAISSRLTGRTAAVPVEHIERASGVRLWTASGREILDAVSGSMTTNLGYTNPDIVEALTAMATRLPYLHETRGRLSELDLLAEELTSLAQPGLANVYFTVSGSDAIEAAIRIALTYHRGRRDTARTEIVGMTGTYHGSTLGALSVTGINRLRRHYVEALTSARRIRLPFCAHCEPEIPFERSCAYAHLDDLEALFDRGQGSDIAAIVIEPVVANASGTVTLPVAYLRRLAELREQHDFLIIADEITTGLGRTGNIFVSPTLGLEPDILCVGKGLGVGYAAMSGVLITDRVMNSMPADRNFLGHNYNSHPLAVAVARTVLARITAPGFQDRLRHLSDQLREHLAALTATSPWVRGFRTAGLLASIDLGPNTSERTWPVALRMAERVSAVAFAEGVLVLPGSGNVDGVSGDHITLAPAFVTTDEELTEMIARLRRAVDTTGLEATGGAR